MREAILANCRTNWLKVARVVWSAHRDLALPDDEASLDLVAVGVTTLVRAGELEAIGDLSDWRHSEVRLTAA